MEPKQIHWRQTRHHWEIYLFIIPTLLIICLFQYYPAASGVFHSFFRWNGADISEPVGLDNYVDLIRNSDFWRSFRVAFIIGIWNVLKMIPALAVAVAIHRCSSARMQFLYRVLFVVPMVIPGLVIVLIWRSFFFEATSGYLNMFLNSTGLMRGLDWLAQNVLGLGDVFAAGKSPAWLGDPRLILTACIIWGFPWVGSFAVLTHLAKLQGIPRDIYEAGEIDGVNWWTKFTSIELPLITGSIYINLVFVIIGTIKDAGTVLALVGFEGGPGGVVTVPALFMLRKAFMDQRMGYACAVGIILTAVVMLLQKLSDMGMEWNRLSDLRRLGARITMLVVAGLLFWADQLFFVAVIMLVLGLPYRAILRRPFGSLAEYVVRLPLFALGVAWLVTKFGPDSRLMPMAAWACVAAGLPFAIVVNPVLRFLGSARDTLHGLFDVSGDVRIRRAFEREVNPVYRAGRSGVRGLLRFNKHLFVWFILAFAFLPVYLMIIVSVKSNQQFYAAPATITQPMYWENWREAWQMVTPTVANSVFICTSATLLTLVFALCGAYFFARLKMPMSGFFWNAILVLMMMPPIANLVPLFRLLRDMNLLNTLTALILVGASGGQIAGIFVLRNFISDVPLDLYEAAEIDGASHLQQMKNIVLPLSGPILGTVGVMHFIGQWNDFVMPLIIIRDHARLPVMVQLLRMSGEYIKLWGPLMAGYAMASIPIIILFVFSMKLFIRGLTEGAVKG